MAFKISSNLRKQITAFIVTLLFFPIARSISPHAVIYYENVHLAYLPVSLAAAMILLFGRNVLIPLTAAYCISYLMIPFLHALIGNSDDLEYCHPLGWLFMGSRDDFG